MSIQLICPKCQTWLTVSDAAQGQLTCPRCLAQLLNPYGVDPSNQTAPRRVMPLEQQVSRDQNLSQGALSAIIGLLAIGGMIMLAGMDLGAVGRILIVVLLIAAVAGLVIIGVRSKRESDATARGNRSIAGPPSIPGALPYRPTPDEDDGRTGLRFAGGFFTAIGVCAGCFILLAATVGIEPKSAHVLFLCIVLAAVIGLSALATSVRQNPSWRGFGPGVTVGLVLGMMALGPCGFCYLMTLG